MMKCKCCKGTDFGVLVKKVQTAPFRMVDGKPQGGPMAEPEEKTELSYTFCFGCNKPITDDDVYEKETCTVCGSEVEETVNGRCADCEAKVKSFNKMTKEELIVMMMKGEVPVIHAAASQEGKSTTGKKQQAKATKTEEEVQPKEVVEAKTEVKPQPIVEQAPVVEATPEPKEEVVANKEVSTKVDVPIEEQNVNLDVEEADLNNDLFPSDRRVVDIGNASDTIASEDDILSQIDNIDISALNIMSEDVTEAI